MASRINRRPVDWGRYSRVAKHNDVDPKYFPEIETALEERLKISCDEYKGILKAMLNVFLKTEHR